MNKFSHYGKMTVLLFLLFPLLLALSSLGGAPPKPGWANAPSLSAILSPNDGSVQLSWEPQAGASTYRVFRAPITGAPYKYTLLAEVSGLQNFYADKPGETGSFVYRVEATGFGSYVYPLAARLVIENFGGLIPVSLDLYPNTVESALRSLESFEAVSDANTGEYLTNRATLEPGMVLKVEEFTGKNLVLVGTMPTYAPTRFNPHQYRLFAIPLGYELLHLKDLQGHGLKGASSHSYVYSDGNNIQLPDDAPYLPGRVYGMRFDRNTEIDFNRKAIMQDSPLSEPQSGDEELLGGSPDDGTQVVVLYDNSYQTKLYKCWSGGKSGAWDGVTDNASGADNVKNAAVVRRGRTMYVKDEAGMTSSTPVTVLAPSEPGNPRQTVAWNVSWNSSLGAAAVTIPATAAVGDYQVRVGTNTGNYVTVYVIFDPAYASSYLNANEYRSWAYADDDWSTLADKKNYLNYVYEGPGYPLGSYPYVYGYRGDHSSVSGANGGVFGQRWVEMACSIHGTGAKTTLEAALHSYEVVGQRVNWVSGQGWYGEDAGTVNTFDNTLKGTIKAPSGTQTISELDVVNAERAALGLGWTNRLPSGYQFNAGACFNYGTCLTAMNRALGIPSRCQHAIGGDGWTSSFHCWSESFLDQPEIHPLDANWWDSYWYEFDSNRPYTSHTTSHSEGSICPIVISGYGDYLINEYMQCEGIGYDGSFFDNSFKCVAPGSNTGTHTSAPLKNGTTNDAEDTDSYPLICTYGDSATAWALMNLFVPWNGPARPSGDANVYDSHHGYALNDSQTGRNGGTSYTNNSTNEDDLPVLPNGVEQKGVIGGWGFMIYRVPVEGRSTITVSLVEGADKVQILGTLDRNIYSTAKRWDLNYDFISDASGVLTANTSGGSQLYLWVQMKGFSVSTPGLGQELAWYTIRSGDSAPYVNAQFSYSRISDYQVQFTDESVVYNDTITSWSWNFGDSGTSTQANPTHTYTTAGYYTVTLTVTGQSAANDSISQQVYVGPNQSPTANFNYNTVGGNAVTFADTSTDPDGTISAWSWNFGDSTTSTEKNPSHTYAIPGTYNVTLTVTDDDGATDDVTKNIAVTLQYCASSASSTVMSITNVVIGSFSNSSGKSLYTDFSSKVVYMNAGQNYSLTITNDNSSYTAYTRIWIDYNRDGDFIDANEKVFEKGQGGGTVTGTISVPASGIVTGQELGLRIHIDTLNYKNPCDVSSGWGEVEDYRTVITGSGGNVPPNADFTFTTNQLVAAFTDTSVDPDGSISSRSWNFGDGGTSTLQNPTHTYEAAGTYSVTLTVTDNLGLTDATSQNVTVSSGGGGNVAPTADYTFTNDGLTTLFDDLSSDTDGSIAAWTWNFDDGQVSTAKEVGHTFTAAGTYNVTLTVTDDDGAIDTMSQNVTVSNSNITPTADFSSSVNVSTVTFTDLSRDANPDGSITGWSWNFGDSSTSTQRNPSHSYASAGTYTVTLTVTDNNSTTGNTSKSVTVNSGSGNTPPVANFTFTTSHLSATFTDTSTDSDGSVVSWSWNFGDSGTSTQRNPSHTYAANGTYTVQLTATDDDGATHSTSKSVTVAANVSPTANYTFTTNNLVATFTDTSSDSDGTIASWSWNFGDSGTSTQQNPVHTYTSAGTYTVQLTVTDNDGATHATSKSVTVATNVSPTANYTFTTNGLTATFTDTSTDSDGTIASWSWNFGDTSTSTQQNPVHTYTTAGTYTVQLTVTDDDGATHSTSKSVTVSGGGMLTYCASSSSSSSFSITKVTIGDFVNSSGKTKYSDFTGMTINMIQGQAYSVSIKVDDSFYYAYTRIWIDYNRDGDFTDSNEKVLEKKQKTTVTGTITVPSSGVVTGQKLGLRIHTDTMNYKNPCDVNSGWGEVEDYAVIIQ